MATIKAYTDLSQSKVLAKILPLESADMKWFFWKEEIDAPKLPTFGYSKTAAESYKDTEAVYLSCWSFAALFDVLPKDSLPAADIWRLIVSTSFLLSGIINFAPQYSQYKLPSVTF